MMSDDLMFLRAAGWLLLSVLVVAWLVRRHRSRQKPRDWPLDGDY